MPLFTDYAEIDRHFARFLCRQAGPEDLLLFQAAALASRAVGNGNVCLDLREAAVDGVFLDKTWEEVAEHLARLPVVGRPGDYAPLILDGAGRLYLYRYWRYEHDLAVNLLDKAGSRAAVDRELLKAGAGRLFPAGDGEEVDWQKVAAVAAATGRLTVISGGPGTGKTTTVIRILALLVEQSGGTVPRIALAAPTGKAAARLRESIRSAREGIDCSETVRSAIPGEASTLHRLLGSVRGTGRFRHNRDNPLPHDVVVVDEASMIDLPLMAKLAEALGRHARLILLGDRDQLASVEAGKVLGDIGDTGRSHAYSTGFVNLAAEVAGAHLAGTAGEPSPLADCLVVLKKNYRFGAASPIGRAVRLVNGGEGEAAFRELRDAEGEALTWRTVPVPAGLGKALADIIVTGYEAMVHAGTPREALACYDRFRVLCAVRRGPYGVEGINALAGEILAGRRLIDGRSRWYRGRPILVTVNDYGRNLFNGDTGIIFPDPADGELRAFFPAEGGEVRAVALSRLPEHETAYAMTVHKSQGSEFSRVLLLLPPGDGELMTRELIYTGMTRARDGVEVWGEEGGFVRAVARKIQRRSGLRERLWGAETDAAG